MSRDRWAKGRISVVGVGASAGGLDPIQTFLRKAPTGPEVSYVLVQHLSPDFKSMMAELLEDTTELEIVGIEDGLALEGNCLYLPPRGHNVVLEEGRFHTLEQDRSVLNLPIDVFFESLAETLGRRAVAVVLSGTGSDGTRGARCVYEHGGVVLVQDPESAQFDGMPRSAIATGVADQVLGPTELAATLAEMVHAGERGLPSLSVPSFLEQIVTVLRRGGGPDFSHYKESTLLRRIDRRLAITKAHREGDYLELLKDSSEERELLVRDVLISVTRFFRDPDAWEAVARDVVIPLVESEPPEIRLWVTACASGEEAYTLAMLVLEALEERQLTDIPVQMFATDLDSRSLQFASEGLYPEAVVADIGVERTDRFFRNESGSFQVRRRLRECVIFAQHDLIRDAPLTRMDLVTCRNVLIYFQPELQQQVLGTLHYGLKPGGHLFLGAAEELGERAEQFRSIERRHKIFQKIRHEPLGDRRSQLVFTRPSAREPESAPPVAESFLEAAFESFLRGQEAACFVVSRDGTLRHAFGETQRYLRPLRGKVDTSIKEMLVPELAVPVTTAMLRAERERGAVSYAGVKQGSLGRRIDLRVSCDVHHDLEPELFTVLLSSSSEVAEAEAEVDADEELVRRVRDTERELQLTRENLQATIEELETTNEEQQATNEELLASNEELQSTNEELHSVNEELYTVNAEFQRSIEELTNLNEDTENLIRASGVGTIFLDDKGLVRNFTPDAARVIPLTPEDTGRSLLSFSHDFADPSALQNFLSEPNPGTPLERELGTKQGRIFSLRRTPFLREGVRDGVVLTLVDVTARRLQEAEAARTGARMQGLLDSSPLSIGIVGDDLRHRMISSATPELLGYGDELIEHTATEVIEGAGEQIDAWRREILETGHEHSGEFTSPTGRRLRVTQFRIEKPDGGYEIGLVGEDVTERHEAESTLRESNELLELILERSPGGLALVGEDGSVTRANREAQRLGVPAGSRLAELFPDFEWANEDSPRDFAEGVSPLARLIEGELDEWSGMARRARGNERSVWIQASSIEQGPHAAILTLNDVTEAAGVRRRLDAEEARLRAVFDTSQALHLVLDAEGRVLLGNEEAMNATGLGPGDWVAASKHQPLDHEGVPVPPEARPVARVLNGGEREVRETFPARRADGKTSYYRMVVRSTPEGEIVAEAVDVSELVEARERAETEASAALASRNELQRRNRTLEEFNSIVSHDLQEPLRTIANYSLLLERELGDAPESTREILHFLRSAAERSKTMVRDLLTYIRLDSTDGKGSCDPAVALESAKKHLAGLIRERGAHIEAAELHGPVALSRSLLRSVFTNLLTNSIRYAEGEPRIRISSTVESGQAAIAVRDDGIGVAEDQFEHVFRPFSRLHSQDAYEGSGMGLSICRQIVESAGGTIRFEPVPSGAKVVFSIPLAKEGRIS